MRSCIKFFETASKNLINAANKVIHLTKLVHFSNLKVNMKKLKADKFCKMYPREGRDKNIRGLSMDKRLLTSIKQVLTEDKRVEFAYLYGSSVESMQGNDIDIAVFSKEEVSPHELSADLKVALYRRTGLPPDLFDIRIINDILNTGDLFALLFLKNILSKNDVIIDRSRSKRAAFIEQYGTKFRECEGLIHEVLF
jgi:predicted nucleotidyltransferase